MITKSIEKLILKNKLLPEECELLFEFVDKNAIKFKGTNCLMGYAGFYNRYKRDSLPNVGAPGREGKSRTVIDLCMRKIIDRESYLIDEELIRDIERLMKYVPVYSSSLYRFIETILYIRKYKGDKRGLIMEIGSKFYVGR